MHENDPEFHRKVILTDEIHFHLMVALSMRVWCSKTSRFTVEKPLHPKWCGLWYGGLLECNFSKMYGLRYRELIIDFSWPEFDDIDLDNVCFNKTAQRAMRAM